MENWKPIKGFDGYYISDLGRVKSTNYKKERFLKYTSCSHTSRYSLVILTKDGKRVAKRIHKLVAEAFLDNKANWENNTVIDHIDGNTSNNSSSNLQVVSQRYNTTKDYKNHSSKFLGVSWSATHNKWHSKIWYNGKTVHLGFCKIEEDAYELYKRARFDIENKDFDIYKYILKRRDSYGKRLDF